MSSVESRSAALSRRATLGVSFVLVAIFSFIVGVKVGVQIGPSVASEATRAAADD